MMKWFTFTVLCLITLLSCEKPHQEKSEDGSLKKRSWYGNADLFYKEVHADAKDASKIVDSLWYIQSDSSMKFLGFKSYCFDTLGFLKQSFQGEVSKISSKANRNYEYEYDSLGRINKVTSKSQNSIIRYKENNEVSYIFKSSKNGKIRRSLSFRYNSDKHVSGFKEKYEGANLIFDMRYSRDHYGNILTRHYYGTDKTLLDKRVYTYNKKGLPLTVAEYMPSGLVLDTVKASMLTNYTYEKYNKKGHWIERSYSLQAPLFDGQKSYYLEKREIEYYK